MVDQQQFDDLVYRCFHLLNGVVNPGVIIGKEVNIVNTDEFFEEYSEVVGHPTDGGVPPLSIVVDYVDGSKEMVVLRDQIYDYCRKYNREKDWETVVLFIVCHELSHAEQMINYNAYNYSSTYRDAVEMGADGNAYRFIINYTQWLANNLNIKINMGMMASGYYESALCRCIAEESIKYCQTPINWSL